MKQLLPAVMLLLFSLQLQAQNTIEAHGNILYYTNDNILHIKVVSGNVPKKGQAVEVHKVFQMGRMSGTHDLAVGTIIGGTDKDLQIKVSEYKSTLVENGVTRPMCKAGDEALIKWEGSTEDLATANFDQEVVDAKTLYLKENYSEAVTAFDKLIAKDAHCLDCYFVRGRALLDLGKAELAIKDFNKVVELHPESAAGIEQAYLFRAKAYYQLEQYEAAIKNYDALLKLDLKTDDVVFLLRQKAFIYGKEELSDKYNTKEAKAHACDCVNKIIALEGASEDNAAMKKEHCE
jgi:tetratricopeptide (TPR) repeat protein